MKTRHRASRQTTVYYWVNPERGTRLSQLGGDGHGASPFFSSVGHTETSLEQQASQDDAADYESMRLYTAKIRKVEDTVDVLRAQSRIDEFW